MFNGYLKLLQLNNILLFYTYKISTEDRNASTEDYNTSTEDCNTPTEDRIALTEDRKASTEDSIVPLNKYAGN
ncbi:MAG: hypothetical protein MI866_04520 [Bacteroidales bacterium]|nr:hypothetical protein [Bacteroidales bacterium]